MRLHLPWPAKPPPLPRRSGDHLQQEPPWRPRARALHQPCVTGAPRAMDSASTSMFAALPPWQAWPRLRASDDRPRPRRQPQAGPIAPMPSPSPSLSSSLPRFSSLNFPLSSFFRLQPTSWTSATRQRVDQRASRSAPRPSVASSLPDPARPASPAGLLHRALPRAAFPNRAEAHSEAPPAPLVFYCWVCSSFSFGPLMFFSASANLSIYPEYCSFTGKNPQTSCI